MTRPLPTPLARRAFNTAEISLSLAALTIAATLGSAANAEEFPPITDTERQLTVVEDQPEATAVILFHNGRLEFMNPRRPKKPSTLTIHGRIKILKEEGFEHGEIEIAHSEFFELADFEARTVRADGTVVALPPEAIFKEVRSQAEEIYVTKAAFPAIEVGALLDYRYVMRWKSTRYLHPWTFENKVPTLRSEIAYVVPRSVLAYRWEQRRSELEIHSELTKTDDDETLRLWMENLPPIPEETSSAPHAALANRVLAVPHTVTDRDGYVQERLPFYSWRRMFWAYQSFDLAFKREARKVARQITADLNAPRHRADAVAAWIRDEIREIDGPMLRQSNNSKEVLAKRAGTPFDKVSLLLLMLQTLKIDAKPVWATNRWKEAPDLKLPTPAWLDRLLVAIEIDDATVFYDPNDPSLAPGRLRPDIEGMPALQLDAAILQITLPKSDPGEHRRHARIHLEVDDAGRATGQGVLELEGHPAWQHLRWEEDDEATREAWVEWLEERFDGFTVGDVEVVEEVDAQRLRVAWHLEQRAEDVLGDELTLAPSRPFGPHEQRFILAPEDRRTPVLLPYAWIDRLSFEVTWPEGWALEVPPATASTANLAGSFLSQLDHDAEARTLRYEWQLNRTRVLFPTGSPYAALRNLYAAAEKNDAQDLVLVLD